MRRVCLLVPLLQAVLATACASRTPADPPLPPGGPAARADAGSNLPADGSALDQVDSIDAFYIGHSLQSDIPDMVRAMAAASSSTFDFKEQFIPGASLRWQWGEAERRQQQFEPRYGGRWSDELPTGRYTALVMVDSVPRGVEQMTETHEFATLLARAAIEGNDATRVFLYEPWHCIETGTSAGCAHDNFSPTRTLTWIARVDADAAMWNQAAADLGAALGRPVRLIPGARVLARLVEEIEAGRVPGFTERQQIFDDEIHINPYGKYAVACAHYAVLFGKSPVGLPFDLQDRWRRSYWDTPNWQNKQWPPPSAAAARAMQEVAWRVVTELYPAK